MTEYPQVVSPNTIIYAYDSSLLRTCLSSHSETSSVSLTRRSPDLQWYGLPPPVHKAVLLDGVLVHSARSAPVPRRFRRSGPFSSEGNSRSVCATFTRAGSYLPLDTLAGASVSYDQNRNLLSFEMVPLWLAPSLHQLPT